jgi:oligoendopeptidase F
MKSRRREFLFQTGAWTGAAITLSLAERLHAAGGGRHSRRNSMEGRIGKGLKEEFPRLFVPVDADLGDPAVVEGLFKKLEQEPVRTAAEMESWLLKWGELQDVVSEEEAIRYIRMTCQTDDPQREKAFLHFVEKVSPRIKPCRHRLVEKTLACPGVADLDKERYLVLLRDFRNEAEIYRDENVPLETEEEKLSQRYQKLTGAMTVNFDGKERTLQEMAKYLELPDREVRRSAWETIGARRLQDRTQLDAIFDEMLALRGRMAKNAGFDNYRDYALRLRGRFDYGVPECEAFHRAVEESVVPLYRELQERRRGRMQLSRLRPYDLRTDPFGRPPLKPFTKVEELVDGCGRIFQKLDPVLGERFRFLVDHDLMDLASRKGKAPGAYSHSLGTFRLPFIFANSVGLDYDVNTLLHECGHSFHTMECRREPLSFYRHAPTEFAEVASMGMEVLGFDYMDVFYGPEDLARSREQYLEGIVSLFCWIATVDAFQHWIYTHPGQTAAERSAAWVDLRRRFGGTEDWSGYEETRRSEWHRQLHIFEAPFYYIEYGIAQLGALQVWQRADRNQAEALAAYRQALALGGSRTLPELFSAAGLVFAFDRATVEPLVRHVKDVLDRDTATQGK